MDIKELIDENTIEKLKKEIKDANGNEVFFRGFINENGIVEDVEVISRGNKHSAPAILKRMKKGEAIIHNHPSGYLYPSDNDINISAIYCNNIGGASYIINNEADAIYVIAAFKEDAAQKISIEEYFSENGKISNVFKGYEYRKEQHDMAMAIEEGLNNNKKVIIEAGTGTGKTLAYLIPVLEYSIKNNLRAVVSTNTINLQEQLLKKDIPLIKNIIKKDFRYALVKGRSNYLCVRKAKNIKLDTFNELSEDRKNELSAILNWASQTNTGDKSELNFEAFYEVWELVNSESDMCLKNKCPYREKCFFNKSRKKLSESDLLVVNHHIYFADLEIRKETGFFTNFSILPDYHTLIFDEAHNIESVARDYFSSKISRYSFNKYMNNIYSYKGERSGKGGSVSRMLSYLRGEIYDKLEMLNIQSYFDNQISPLHQDLYEKGNDFFNIFIEFFIEKIEKGETKIRFTNENTKNNKTWDEKILKRFNNVKSVFIKYQKTLKEFYKIIDEANTEDDNGVISDFVMYGERLNVFFKEFDFILKTENENFVYWTEINLKYSNAVITASPLIINDELQENLYDKIERIIFTSATLAIENKFEYFKKSLGIVNDSIEKVIESPFDYKKQMKVIIPLDISLPTSSDFLHSIKDFVIAMLLNTKGNAFILFTSYSTMYYMHNMIEKQLENMGFDIMLQGKMPRHKLLENFKLSQKPVLFGTDSFWEGVDVQGEKLQSVIIVKLPFKVPTEPVVEALIENISKKGGNPFMEYQIPEALIKFKQGIGRLIRSKTDYGYLTILDTRVTNKTYGKKFLEILKKGDILSGNQKDILNTISKS